MKNTVFLNSGKVDFDNQLDYASLRHVTNITTYKESSQEEILERITGQNIIISKEIPLSRDLIEKFPPSVELICEAGTGYNNIDLAAAKEKNISVCNIPAYSSEAVAQLTIAFLLDLSSSLSRQQVMLSQGNYDNFNKHLMVNHVEINKKTLGVIGAGNIARQVIKVARALGMNVLVNSRSPRTWDDPQIQQVSLDELLKASDFVAIHCPLTPDTRHLINKEKLQLMKSTAFIINTARGAIINEGDLIEALENKTIAGAALDVQDPEPPKADNPLFSMDNVILTPHIGWKCSESRQRLMDMLAENIRCYTKGKPVNVVS
ncbi:MAG: NAD(P)-dependent oxidoreductase [Clostridiales bacterium]